MTARPLTIEEAEYLIGTNHINNNSAWRTYYPETDAYYVWIRTRDGTVWVIYGRDDLPTNNGFHGGWQIRTEKSEDIKYPMPEPEFDLDDMELAEIIMEEMK